MLQFVSMLIKILLASLLVGAALSALDMDAAQILQRIGLTPDEIVAAIRRGVAWATPNIILGSFVIVPLWCLAYILRPPRG